MRPTETPATRPSPPLSAAGASPNHDRTAPRPKRRILVVDDNPDKTLALQSVVEELGYGAVVATSAEAALRELLKQEFALALLDVHMPGMDGFELAQLIRSRPVHADLAIVFMSAIDQTDDRLENAYRLGAIDFIPLPASRPVIKAKLSSLLGFQEKAYSREILAEETGRRRAPPDERFRLLLDNTEDVAIFFVDSDGIVAEWSRSAQLCTGWSPEEIVGREFGIFFVPGDVADRVPHHLLVEARNGRRGVSERWLVRKDGTRFWARFCLVSLGGTPDAGFGVMLRDVSPEKDAEHELQIKAEVLETMNESVSVVDDEFRIIYANAAAVRTFGYELEELIGSDVRILNDYTPAENVACIARLIAHFEHSRQWVGEWPNRRKDGTPFVTQTRLSTFHHHGARYLVCVQEDLTMRKEAEAALERSAQLQEVVGELEAFSYSVSHDLKSPLRTLRGFADAVIHEYGDALQGPGMHYMLRIRLATERLERMVEDILTVSRLPRDSLPLAPVDLNRVIVTVLDDAPSFRLPHAEVAIQGILPPVLGHEPSLRQVFFNLLGNAVKFVPADRRPRVVVRADVDGGVATIWVDDNGVGVKPEDYERVFRVFERSAGTQSFPGSGIGLAIVKRTVERLGGAVGVRSQLGAGSGFWVKLRAAPSR